jgi:hypothetical protein
MTTELIPKHEQPVEPVEPVHELLDPYVQQYSRALLRAISVVRQHATGQEIPLHSWPAPLCGRGQVKLTLAELSKREFELVEKIVERQQPEDPFEVAPWDGS